MQKMCTKSYARRVIRRGPDSIVLVFQERDRHNIPLFGRDCSTGRDVQNTQLDVKGAKGGAFSVGGRIKTTGGMTAELTS